MFQVQNYVYYPPSATVSIYQTIDRIYISETVAQYFLGAFIVNRLIFSAFIDIRNLLFFQRSQIGYEHGFVDIVLGEGS
ncbi:hypothetical protein SJDPG4_05840 [Porphyromonas gingivalis SJD4]|nr:hypothetical protein SJDPG4_05840 [Porphyromonas gingivalis SJD4]